MSSDVSDLAEMLVTEVVDARVAQAASVAVAVRHEDRWFGAAAAAGQLRPHDSRAKTHADTPFDLASVTKPFLATCCARLEAAGELDLKAKLETYLPEVEGTHGGEQSLEDHLSHRAGLVPHLRLFRPLLQGRPVSKEAALHKAASARGPQEAGTAVYSDLGYILVGHAVERVAGTALDQVIRREAGTPLDLPVGSSRQWRGQFPSFRAQVAPTEVVPWRGGVLLGVVHDDNAWALSGQGTSGHAGLFGTASAVLGLGVAVLDALKGRSKWLSAAAAHELTSPRAGGTLRMGFDGKSGVNSSAGSVAGPNTFGHLGYTGTSLWCDPDREVATVLLTNRVHPSHRNIRIRRARPRVHDFLFQRAWKPGASGPAEAGMIPLRSSKAPPPWTP